MALELRHWAAFATAAETRHFGLAAEQLNISQPALSQLVKVVEVSFGVALFDRSRRRVSLTEAGQALLPEARAILSQARRAERIGQTAGRGANRVLTMGYVGSAPLNPKFLTFIRALAALDPPINLQIDQNSVTDQVEQVADRRLDLGVIRSPMPTLDPSLVSVGLAAESLVIAVPSRHWAAQEAPLELAQFADEMFIQYRLQTSGGLHALVKRSCEQAGFTPRIAQTVPQIATMICLVGAGLGVALVPASAERLAIADVVYRPLRKPIPTDLNVVYRRSDTGFALRDTVRILRQINKSGL